MLKIKKLFHIAALLLTVGTLSAGQFAAVGKAETAPDIDGKLDDACYKKSLPLTGFVYPSSMNLAAEQTEIRLVYDDKYLYCAVNAKQKNAMQLPQLTPSRNNMACWKYDSVELFFAESAVMIKQFMFDYSGSFAAMTADCSGKERKVTINKASGVKVAAGCNNSGWQLEIAIPRNEIPAGELKFHVVRNHKGKGHSCWNRMPEINWHTPDQYGTLKLRDCVPAMTFDKLPDMLLNSKLAVTLDCSKALDVTLTASGKTRTAKSVNNKSMIFEYKVLPDKRTVDLTIKCPRGGLLYAYKYELPAGTLDIKPYNLPENKLLLASGVDLESTVIWNSKHNLPNGDPKNGSRYRIDNFLIFEVPEGITPLQGKLISETVVNGKKIFTYEQKERFAFNAHSWINSRFNSSLPAGSRGSIRYRLQWKDGVQPWRKIPYEVITIKPAPAPKKFINGFYNHNVKDVEAARKLANLGINTFTVRGYGDDVIKRSLALQKAGFFVKRSDYFWPGAAHAGGAHDYLRWTSLDRQARSRDIDGYYIPNGTGYLISPTYRGKLYKEAIQKEIEFCKKANINYFAFDMEDHIQTYGERGDFSLRTVELFKKYWAEKYPGKKYIDPKVFERDPKKYPFYHTAWVEFKCDQWADFFAEMKKRFAEGLTDKCQSSPVKGVLFTEWSINRPFTEEDRNHSLRNRKFFEVFNIIETSFYSSVDRDMRQFTNVLDQFAKNFPGLKVDFIFTPSPYMLNDHVYYQSTAPDYPDRFKYILMESFAFGCKGIQTYHYSMVNLQTMRQMSEAMNILSKIEDVVMNGERFKLTTNYPPVSITDRFGGKMQTWENQEQVFAKGLRYANKDLITVSEYRSFDRKEVVVNYAPGRKVQLKDIETNKVIGVMNANDKSLKVTIEPERRCIMILAETIK